MTRTCRVALIAVVALGLPISALAAGDSVTTSSLVTARSLILATSSPGNAYVGGASVVVAAPVLGDLSALGGTLTVAAPIAGDALLLGGSASVRAPISGDLRVIAGNTTIEKAVMGDLATLGVSMHESAHVQGSVFIAALNATLSGGASGPVTVYGNTIILGGDYTGDVRVFAGDRLTLLPGTVLHGSLVYQAPIPASIPDTAHIEGGVTYTEASYLPGANVSRTLALISIGVFLLARILAMLILAGLLTGLFPLLADGVIDEAYGVRTRHLLLTTLLGFAAFVAVPILILLLALTFIGFALAILLFIAYALLIFLALIYAGVLLGGVAARRFLERDGVLWRDGVLGMLALSLLALLPVVGLFIVIVLTSFAAGALLQIFFRFAFVQAEQPHLL